MLNAGLLLVTVSRRVFLHVFSTRCEYLFHLCVFALSPAPGVLQCDCYQWILASIRLTYAAVSSTQHSLLRLAFFLFSSQLLQTHSADPSQQFSLHCYADEAQLTRLCKSKRDERHFGRICLMLEQVLNEQTASLLETHCCHNQVHHFSMNQWVSGVVL